MQYYQTLSPAAKERVVSAVGHIKSAAVHGYHVGKEIYPTVMALGTKPVKEWKQPSDYVLKPLAHTILFLFPVQSGEEMKDVDRTILIGNEQIYGLGTLPLLADVYLKTGKWIRVVSDPVNFKLPGVKHCIEYFGAVDRSQPEVLRSLCEGEYTVLLGPNGAKDYLRPSTIGKYDIELDSEKFLEIATDILPGL
jgi:hypothetical protein